MIHVEPIDVACARRVVVPLGLMPDTLAAMSDGRLAQFGGDTMGTTWTVGCVLSPQHDDAHVDSTIRNALDAIIAEMSHWRADSDIGRFNRAPSDTWIDMPPACLRVIDTALQVARLTGGAFDPSAGPLVDLWGFGPAGRCERVPCADDVEAMRRRCGWQRIELDRDANRVRQPGGAVLDLGSIAKGFAVDAIDDALGALGIAHRLVVGGELRGEGVKPDGSPWWVEIETPP